MLESVQLSKILFVDIETVSGEKEFNSISSRLQPIWQKRAKGILRLPNVNDVTDDDLNHTYKDRAAIYAEFGKIVCISVGYIKFEKESNQRQLRIRSFANATDEKQLLEDFSAMINQYFNDPERFWICGHNIKEFDIPYLCRRLMIHQIESPTILRLAGKKPWETKHLLDTLNLWKFGDVKNYTSLELLAAIFNIDTPKDDIDGSMVGTVFWEEDDLDRIVTYCEKDVLTVCQVFLYMIREDLLTNDEVVFTTR